MIKEEKLKIPRKCLQNVLIQSLSTKRFGGRTHSFTNRADSRLTFPALPSDSDTP